MSHSAGKFRHLQASLQKLNLPACGAALRNPVWEGKPSQTLPCLVSWGDFHEGHFEE